MSSYIPVALARQTVERAGNRCEYCGLLQLGQEATFHVDHVQPVAAGGATVLENLTLACVSCSLKKGARQTGTDPDTDQQTPLFNPRTDRWDDHMEWDGVRAVGLTPTGRATIAALDMNRPLILAIREEETERGRHPPPSVES
ncbi:MAG: HNH endonuclease [Planctomycetia bacterium]|nr:HNH endonuclease [Planctomycetia bacterium]